MKAWPVQDAKARFSELLDTCLSDGPQLVTRRGEAAAVLVPAKEWVSMVHAAPLTLKDLLLAQSPRASLDIPARGTVHRRIPPELG